MDKDELKKVLDDHRRWINQNGGERADLRRAYFRRADLQRAYLQGACLQGAYLQGADLRRAYLRGADLQGVDLQGADLRRADLQRAYLQGADLRRAYLQGADLRRADLQRAYLQGAYLQGACLQGADLQGAHLPHFQIPHGELIVYKRVACAIVRLRIPEKARRTASLVGRKCRAEYAIVDWIEGGAPVTSNGYGNGSITYAVGETVYPDKYDDDIRVECSSGVHFFLTREEAEEWM